MFRKELLITFALALAIFSLVALLASAGEEQVQTQGRLLARDTLPGLVYAGDALNKMNENWMLADRLLSAETGDRQTKLITQINANSTDATWKHYKEAISDPRDAALFQAMEASRRLFFDRRGEYFRLITSSTHSSAAVGFFETQLDPLFVSYRKAAVGLFSFNVQVGQERAHRLIALSRWTPVLLGLLCVFILLGGVLVGFKASLGAFSGNWVPPAEDIPETPSTAHKS